MSLPCNLQLYRFFTWHEIVACRNKQIYGTMCASIDGTRYLWTVMAVNWRWQWRMMHPRRSIITRITRWRSETRDWSRYRSKKLKSKYRRKYSSTFSTSFSNIPRFLDHSVHSMIAQLAKALITLPDLQGRTQEVVHRGCWWRWRQMKE